MSYPNNFSNGSSGRNVPSYGSHITAGQLNNPSTSTMNPYQPGRIPMVYSRPSITARNQMTDSEPLSEYSEMQVPMTPMHTTHQMNSMMSPYFRPQMSPYYGMTTANLQNTSTLRKVESRPERMRSNDVRATPYKQPPFTPQPQLSLLPPPTPQYFATHQTQSYSPDQSFSMRSATSPADRNVSFYPKKFEGAVAMKINSKNAKPVTQVTKLSPVNRKRFLVGSIDQIVHWNKLAKEDLYVIYEVTAILETLTLNPKQMVYTMILCDEQKSNVLPLQAVFYPIDRELPEVRTGGLTTFVGCMIGARKLQVFNMWPIDSNSLAGLKRISFLCQRTLQEACLSPSEP